MLILAVEASAKSVSVALLNDESIVGEVFINTSQTHSETLMPAIESIIKAGKLDLNDIDLFAVSHGPGSFTGVRIGISCIKGLAFTHNTKCMGISALETIAFGGTAFEGKEICAVMDARRQQVYNGVFRIENGIPVRLCEDRAISIEALLEERKNKGDNLVLMGDGASLCYEYFKETGAILAPEQLRYQKASSVAFAALAQRGETVEPSDLIPIYLRMPQAERELKKKLGGIL